MQAKIIDFASDKLVNQLSKLEKNDVQKAMTSVSQRFQRKPPAPPPPASSNVKSSEEYCAMVQNEFPIKPNDLLAKQKSHESAAVIGDSMATGINGKASESSFRAELLSPLNFMLR